MPSTTVVVLRYVDASAAIEWLCRAFGFREHLRVPGPGGRIEHARLTLEAGMIMLASLGRDGDIEACFRSPAEVGGVTQCTSMRVSDPDAVYATARAAGARILADLADFQFGGRTFSCLDLEGHAWIFTSHDPWQKTWD